MNNIKTIQSLLTVHYIMKSSAAILSANELVLLSGWSWLVLQVKWGHPVFINGTRVVLQARWIQIWVTQDRVLSFTIYKVFIKCLCCCLFCYTYIIKVLLTEDKWQSSRTPPAYADESIGRHTWRGNWGGHWNLQPSVRKMVHTCLTYAVQLWYQ